MNFNRLRSSNDISKATVKFAASRDLEVLLYNQTDDLGRVENRFIEIWPADDNAEMPFVTYLINADQDSLQLYAKHTDCNKAHGKGNIEDLLYTIRTDKELRQVIEHIYNA
jgi:hypothetical protein